MNKNIKKDICVLDFAFQRIGGKYKGRILWALSKHTRIGEIMDGACSGGCIQTKYKSVVNSVGFV